MKIKIISLNKVISFNYILILFVFNNRLYSQIIYTDIPDATPNATYLLDLNNDNIHDFIIQFGGSNGTVGVICYPQNNNAYSGEFVNGTYLPWALSTSNSICASLATWYDSSNPGIMGLGANTGYWPGVSNKYLALKLIVGENTYYGWARFDLSEMSESFTIKEYAYESMPNTCIQSGQTILGTNENTAKSIFSFYPNPFSSSTTIKTNYNLKNATLTIFNSYGQTVKQLENISRQTISLFRDNLPNGSYFARITEENRIIAVEKLIITN